MNATECLARLRAARALVLLRAEELADSLLDAYVDGGIQVLEMSMVARDAVETMRRARKRHPGVVVGAGTVRTAAQAREAVDAGAQFLVSPSAAVAVTEFARQHDVLHLPGVLTPTEVDDALQRGARMLKLFPAALGGPRYIRDLRAPFPEADFFVSGGVSIDTAPDYLAAGASVIGMGGALAASTDADEIRRLSSNLVKAVTA
jgi:2-dehydro-3-deoxyphosphogluconate aldolase/(4S)-4-hydroxy-2-oxoglutarate aldolase